MSGVDSDAATLNYYSNNFLINEKFSFTLLSVPDVASILMSIKSQSIGIDGLSIKMLSLCCPHVLPVITHIINSCFLENTFPDS